MGPQMVKIALNSRGFFSKEVLRYFIVSKTLLSAGPWYKFGEKTFGCMSLQIYGRFFLTENFMRLEI